LAERRFHIRGAEQPATDSSPRRLDRDALPSDTIALARFLIGKTLVHEIGKARLGGRIVETEAYLTGDAASHAFRGETRRNRSMFLERGHAYVYIAYGCWPVLNVTSEAAGIGTAALVRALEPLEGIEEMQLGRKPARLVDLTRGPGRLAAAMRITMAHDGVDLCGTGPLWLGTPVREPDAIGVSTRIGISKDTDRPLRFFERGSRYVSGPRRLLGDAGAAKLQG
jgi:DNA-3-methyladenine glycosylase